MEVTTLAVEKIDIQKIKFNRLLFWYESNKFRNLHKLNIYSKTIKYYSHSYTLRF